MNNEKPFTTKPQFFPPKKHHPSCIILHEVELSQELKVIVTDSDPYDALTYLLHGKPIATEYVASYEKRLQEIHADLGSFCVVLKEYSQTSDSGERS